MADHILLKWGTMKAWRFESPTSRQLMQKYLELGTSMSAMAQEDTAEQQEILYELFRQHDGTIRNDWDGETYTADQAIDYIKNYRR